MVETKIADNLIFFRFHTGSYCQQSKMADFRLCTKIFLRVSLLKTIIFLQSLVLSVQIINIIKIILQNLIYLINKHLVLRLVGGLFRFKVHLQ